MVVLNIKLVVGDDTDHGGKKSLRSFFNTASGDTEPKEAANRVTGENSTRAAVAPRPVFSSHGSFLQNT